MKALQYIFTLLLVLTCWRGFAQQMAQVPVDETTPFITYSAVVPTPKTSQADLLTRTRVWANSVTISTKQPLVVNEQGTDVVIVTGTQVLNNSYFNTTAAPQTLYYTATVALRDGRYHYRVTDFVLETPGSTPPFQPFDMPAENAFLHTDPPKAKGSSYLTHLRQSFDEATGQIMDSLHRALNTSLTVSAKAEADW
jgi:hypothetical protein